MKQWKTILYEKMGNIAKITTNRPHVLNAQSRLLLEELDEAFMEAEADDEIVVIVVAGAGEHFSAGHDMGSPEELEDRERRPIGEGVRARYRRNERLYLDMCLRWRNLKKPTIAMVQGYCIMGGYMLATCCDLIIASEDAKFADRAQRQVTPHVQYFTLPWEIGIRKTKEHLFTGEYIDAQEAYRLGLVNRVVPREKLEEETMALARKIALNDPFILRLFKSSINEIEDIMGFTTSIISGFKSHELGTAHRADIGFMDERLKGKSVGEYAKARDAAYEDHHGT